MTKQRRDGRPEFGAGLWVGQTMAADRRRVLKAMGGVGAAMVFGCKETTTAPVKAGARASACVLNPHLTSGPFWVDEGLNRSSITSDPRGKATPNPKPGLPLSLALTVMAVDQVRCAPLPNAQVDIWHCDADGLYSDARDFNGTSTEGQAFLRGYQTTDANGVVRFATIYPGWYNGRAVHIHVKVRQFDASRHAATEATTQLFFDDATTDAVYAKNAPYNARGPRDTRNGADMIYDNQNILLVDLQGHVTEGFRASAAIGVQVGTQDPPDRGPPGGPGPWGHGPGPGGPFRGPGPGGGPPPRP